MIIANTSGKSVEEELSHILGGIFFEIHNELGRFCRERQYADALEEKCRERNITFQREYPIEIAGRKSNSADFIVEKRVIIEIKAKRILDKEDYYQVKRYLETTGVELGLLVNFRDRFYDRSGY